MKIFTFKNREEWLVWRDSGTGASDAASIMGCGWTSKENFFAQKMGWKMPTPPNQAMKIGLEKEAEARAWYEKEKGIKMPPLFAAHDRFYHILASMDDYNHEMKCPLEIKVPSSEKSLSLREIPKMYQWQCAQILLVTGDEQMDFCNYDWRRGKGIIIPFFLDKRMESTLLLALIDFWNAIKKGDPLPKTKKSQFKELSFQEKLKIVQGGKI